ncbi:LuxR C-terminal-related transcriptional regulator [Spirillospora sp. NPDC048911]|uniref:LuxR C-terminal-related transcriptional regulator n=1 Tax=Spirillospora sp. NPDC048911 TaxID=3364527 RepID=UPI003721B718
MTAPVLYGRNGCLAEIRTLVDRARLGLGGTLVVRGEAGIGKSVLLERAARFAADGRVLRVRGVASETDPPPDDRPSVGVASLLAGLPEAGPLLCLVDDAQWLDQASTDALADAARRLGGERIALVLAADGDASPFPSAEWRLAPLGRADAEALLDERAGGLPPDVRARVLGQAAGNPLALLELAAAFERLGAHTVTPGQERDVPFRWAFQDRLQRLPEPAREALTVVAADDTGDLGTVLRALEALGHRRPVLASAERDGLLAITGASIGFRHPLARSAAYGAAPLASRLAAHRALAETAGGFEQRSRHLAAGVLGPDEATAQSLENTGDEARRHGDLEAAANAYERAARLTPPQANGEGRRLVAAARAWAGLGRLDRAEAAATRAAGRTGDPRDLAAVAEVRAAVERERGSPRLAGTILLDGARRAGDAVLVSRLLGDAVLGAGYGADHDALLAAAAVLDEERHLDAAFAGRARWVRALAGFYAADSGTAVPELRAGLAAPGAMDEPPAIKVTMVFAAHAIGDDAVGARLAARLLEDCRGHDSAVLLPDAMQMVVLSRLVQGDHTGARRLAGEALEAAGGSRAAHRAGYLTGLLAWLAAAEGDGDRVAALAEKIGWATTSGSRPVEGWVTAAWALLELGRGRPQAALDRLRALQEGPASHVLPAVFALPDHVEAAVRAGHRELAVPAAERFTEFAEHTGQPWAQAVALRCRALLATGEDAGRAYETAVSTHPSDRRPFERARTELLYGEWLRRRRRRGEARSHLRAAAAVFAERGALPWAGRARGELDATGERTARSGPGGPSGRLTSQELQVVRLAATGASNREIAVRLSLSPHTVGYHLYKAFPKLGVTSRIQLRRLDLPETWSADG